MWDFTVCQVMDWILAGKGHLLCVRSGILGLTSGVPEGSEFGDESGMT